MTLLIPAVHHLAELGRIRRTKTGDRVADDGRDLERIRPGVYAHRQDWAAASTEGRVIARAHALGLIADDAVFSHETAAALHGLPLFRPDRTRVHLTVSHARPGSAVGTIRHRGSVPEEEIVEIRGRGSHRGLRERRGGGGRGAASALRAGAWNLRRG